MVAIRPTFVGSKLAEAMDFKGYKNPQHTSLQTGSKAVSPVSYNFTA
jgi:hypothetical protein